MANPTITAVVAGAKIAAGVFGAQVKAGLDWLFAPPSVGLSQSVALTMTTSGTIYLLSWDTEDWDIGTMHTGSGSAVTVPANGRYEIRAQISWAANATGVRALYLRKNAAGSSAGGTLLLQLAHATSASGIEGVFTSKHVQLLAGETIELFGQQTSGGSLNTNGLSTNCFLQVNQVSTS